MCVCVWYGSCEEDDDVSVWLGGVLQAGMVQWVMVVGECVVLGCVGLDYRYADLEYSPVKLARRVSRSHALRESAPSFWWGLISPSL